MRATAELIFKAAVVYYLLMGVPGWLVVALGFWHKSRRWSWHKS